MSERECTIYDETGKRRVVFTTCGDGCYTFSEETFSDDPMEMNWIPVGGRRSYPICESYDIAVREASGRVSWLAEASGESRENPNPTR